MLVASLLVLITALSDVAIAKENEDLVVKLAQPQSQIRGHVLLSAKGNEYYAFQEIPYAEPPIGQYRFKPPVPHNGWDGVLNTTENTRKCFQCMSFGNMEKERDSSIYESEDCLFLNVYTPVTPGSNNSLSVFIFVHGGAFAVNDGTFQSLGPKYLMDGNIIVITINYRMGPFGFLSTGDHVISGNMGLKDQLRAIEWTRDNIHLFGGNPRDIVVGGQSAGSFSMAYHFLNPKSAGLVSGFIQESGSAIGIGAYLSNPRQYAMTLGKMLDQSLDSDNTSSIVSVLEKASAEEITKAALQMAASPTTPTAFGPVLEDSGADQAIATVPMHQGFMDGNFIRVPSLIGFNSEESVFQVSSDEVMKKAAASYDSDPSLLINEVLNVENRTLVGTKLKKVYTSTSFAEDLYAYVRYNSDQQIILGTIRQAELASKHIPVYLYQLSAGQNMDSRFPGIAHSYDVGYLFDDGAMSHDEATREVMLKLWWNFIRYKNPTPEVDPALQNIQWPTVQPDNLLYLNLNYTLSVESGPRKYTSVRDVLLEYLRPPFYIF